MQLPVIHIQTPHVPCICLINGALAGDHAHEPVLPVAPNGTAYITCLPLAADGPVAALPKTIALPLKDGAPTQRVPGCTLYLEESGLIHVEIALQTVPLQSHTQPPYALSRAMFTYQGRPCAATLYRESGCTLAVENMHQDTLMLLYPLADFTQGRVQAIPCFSQVDLWVTGEGPYGPRSILITPLQEGYTVVADEYAHSRVQPHTLLCTQPLDDVCGHETQYTITLQQEQGVRSAQQYGYFSAAQRMPQTPQQLCTALCQAVQLELAEEALSFLAPALREDMTLSDLAAFFGPFSGVFGATGDGPVTLTLAQTLYDDVYLLHRFSCEVEQMQIVNISPF